MMTNAKSPGKTLAAVPAAEPAKAKKPRAVAAAAAKQAKAAATIPANTAVAKVARSAKAAKPKAAVPAGKPAAAPAPAAKPKHKLVRDSFTIPKSEYAVLDALKLRAANLKRPTKKSEVLRAGIVALAQLSDKAFLTALESVPVLKTGRPRQAAPATA